jgi:hypothetical protein
LPNNNEVSFDKKIMHWYLYPNKSEKSRFTNNPLFVLTDKNNQKPINNPTQNSISSMNNIVQNKKSQ